MQQIRIGIDIRSGSVKNVSVVMVGFPTFVELWLKSRTAFRNSSFTLTGENSGAGISKVAEAPHNGI